MSNMDDFKAAWDDALKQKEYSIYHENGEYLGMIGGHDAEHAVSKFAQYDERDPDTLIAERTWPDSKY